MEGGTTIYNVVLLAVSRTSRFHPMIEDWFTYSGGTFTFEEYSQWSKAYEDWETESVRSYSLLGIIEKCDLTTQRPTI
jgi:hypothetical protein